MIDKNAKVFINLVKAGLCGIKTEVPPNFNLESFYNLSTAHRISNLCYHGVVLSGVDENKPIIQKLYKCAVAELMFHEKQSAEQEKLFSAFEKNQISYMPLKGSVLKTLYKKPELRNMGDVDVLIKVEEYPKIKELMENSGFEFKYESNHEIVWKKGTRLTVELHKALFPSYTEEFYSPYKDIWSKAVKTETEYRYRLSYEDEFVYSFTHFVKHYKLGGIGIKHICDLWVQMEKRELDFAVIEGEIEKLSLTEFYKNIRKTIDFWFSDGEADEKVELITKTLIKSGSFGTKQSAQNALALRLASEGKGGSPKKFTFWLFKIFPNKKFIMHKYSFLKKHGWLLPFAWALRWFDALFIHTRKIKSGIKAIKRTDNNRTLQMEKDFLAVGLKYNHTEE